MVLRKVATHTPSEQRDADEAYEQNGCGDGSNHYRVLQRWSLTRIRPRSYRHHIILGFGWLSVVREVAQVNQSSIVAATSSASSTAFLSAALRFEGFVSMVTFS